MLSEPCADVFTMMKLAAHASAAVSQAREDSTGETVESAFESLDRYRQMFEASRVFRLGKNPHS